MKANFCFDACEHNPVPRRSIKDGQNFITFAESGMNKKLSCGLGYLQTVNSHKAFVNSQLNNSHICPALRKLFKKEERNANAR
jgi:hypothetical protein